MQRLSISEFSSFRWTFFQDVVKYSKLGVNSIGVWRSKIDEYGYEEAAELLDEMQMSVSSLSWAGGFTGSDGNSHVLAVEDALEAVYQAHMIGADKLLVYPGGRNNHTESHAMRLAKSGIESILPTARDLGVKLVVEPILSKNNPWSFIAGPEQYLELVNGFCPQQVGLVLDLFHVGRTPEFIANISTLIDRIALVQLADGRHENGEFIRCQLGAGSIPVRKWLDLLERNEYDGGYEIELHGADFENRDYPDILQRSRDFFASSVSRIQTKTTS